MDVRTFVRHSGNTSRTAMRVLLVDDEQEICSLLAAILSREGIGTAVAHSMAEARDMLDAGAFDAVFLDLHLPDGMGYDLMPSIRRHRPPPKVIVISAVDGAGDDAMRKGADLFLPKPFTRRLILEKLRDLVPGTNTSPDHA